MKTAMVALDAIGEHARGPLARISTCDCIGGSTLYNWVLNFTPVQGEPKGRDRALLHDEIRRHGFGVEYNNEQKAPMSICITLARARCCIPDVLLAEGVHLGTAILDAPADQALQYVRFPQPERLGIFHELYSGPKFGMAASGLIVGDQIQRETNE